MAKASNKKTHPKKKRSAPSKKKHDAPKTVHHKPEVKPKKTLCQKAWIWAPRILSILFILFISMFVLDSFGEGSFAQQIIGFLIHMIPTFVLIIITLIAWKRYDLGGILFLIVGVVFTLFFNTYRYPMSFILISCPLFLVGFLYLAPKLKGYLR